MIPRRTDTELERLREAGKIVALVHQRLKMAIAPGLTTLELDQIAESCIREHGAIPSFKGYHGFPGSICASVNEEVVHGIPSQRQLQNGDVISIDVGACFEGYHGDSAWTYLVGEGTPEAEKLLRVTEESLYRGLEQARAGRRLSDISHAIQTYVESEGFSIVREYAGHGVGRKLHEEPNIPNYGPPGKGPPLQPGYVLAIEPMVTVGKRYVHTLEDDWTVVTSDRSLSAHFEHTVVISPDGLEILTQLERGC
jgi:methionyl aminopeptidase